MKAIHKVDDKTKSNDFVSSDKAAYLALMLQDLIASFDFQYKQVRKLKKAHKRQEDI